MMPVRRTSTLVAVLMISAMFDVVFSQSCNCNNGNVDIYEPQCLCSCYPGYLMPSCLYRADDTVSVQIWVTVSPEDFYSDQLVQTLAWALPIKNTSQVAFLYAHPYPQYNRTAAYVSMKGDRAQQLNWDFTSSNEWLDEANIEAAWDQVPELPQSTTYGASLFVYKSSDGKILITVENIMWLIAALVLCFSLSIIETCCSSNNEEVVYEYYVEHHTAMTNLVDGNLQRHQGGLENENNSDGESSTVAPTPITNPLKGRHAADAPTEPHKIFSDRTRR